MADTFLRKPDGVLDFSLAHHLETNRRKLNQYTDAMKRRDFIVRAGAGALVGGTLAGCGSERDKPKQRKDTPVRHWKMITAWPRNFPVLGTGAEYLADLIGKISNQRLQIKVYAAGELVPALEGFDAVSQGVAEMGHAAAYYWKGKNPAFQFFSTVPFGMNRTEMNAWLYEGGGINLWEEAYEPFGVIPMPAGNTCMQMAGWFNREINSVADLQGLKMRIPGLGGEVLRRAGGLPVTLPGGELLTAMQTGVIDATEWINPYSDLAFGLYKVAKYCYYPGWHEPGTTLECIVQKNAFEQLPDNLQQAIKTAAQVVNQRMAVEYTARNNDALKELQQKHKVDIRRLPIDVLAKLKKISDSVVREIGGNSSDDHARRVYNSYTEFHQKVQNWHSISEKAYYDVMADLSQRS